jgi:hypothetical protein
MGEIKSTLDLVMERTKHLKMSSAEKEAQRFVEIEQKTKGLVQRFVDQALNMEQFRRELDRFKKEYHLTDMGFLSDAIWPYLEIGQPADRLLLLLVEFCNVDTAALKQVFRRYEKALADATAEKSSELNAWLKDTYKISGSAVEANLDKDPLWLHQLKALAENYGKQLSQQIAALKRASQ